MNGWQPTEVDRRGSDGMYASSDPEVISQQIDHTREAMAETLDEIQRRLEPEHVTSYLKDVAYFIVLEVKALARDMAGQMRESMPDTPAPGIALPTAVTSAYERQARPTWAQESNGSTPGDAFHTDKEQGGSMPNQAQRLWQKVEANPIAIGALGLALGGVLAAAAPRTAKEDHLLGETRDHLLDTMQETATRTVDSVRTAAVETGTAVLEEATGTRSA